MKIHTTNYYNTFIEIAEDCPTVQAEIPPSRTGKRSIASIQFDLMAKSPYKYTSDDILLLTFAERNDLMSSEYDEAKRKLFSKGQACLRTSALAKRYGWGIHHNERGQVAMFAMNSDKYLFFVNDKKTAKVKAMRSKKK
jgi:hypothetical protein